MSFYKIINSNVLIMDANQELIFFKPGRWRLLWNCVRI